MDKIYGQSDRRTERVMYPKAIPYWVYELWIDEAKERGHLPFGSEKLDWIPYITVEAVEKALEEYKAKRKRVTRGFKYSFLRYLVRERVGKWKSWVSEGRKQRE